MPTLKRRLNISLPNYLDTAIRYLAKRDQVPQATKATDLLELALEIEEDGVWDKIARKRDTKDAKYIGHDKTWS
ncbi:MAG: toxin-antitoxin system, antitoxin component [Parcubacteria group bacterium]